MKANRRVLEQVLTAYQEGDLDECIRRVRTLVEAAPLAPAPRQLLASLFAECDKGRQAVVHYRKLLPQALARGEAFKAIAIQKRIDAFTSGSAPDPERWTTLLAGLRAHGLPHVAAPPAGRPWAEAQMLSLPRVWFDRLVAETRVQILSRNLEPEDVEAGTVWEVLGGRVRWSFALPDGRVSVEASAAEGDAIHVDPDLTPRARVRFAPELPVESLRFEAAFARELKAALAAALPLSGASADGFTPDARALLPSRPRRREDIDVAPPAPTAAAAEGPPRLAVPAGEGDTPRTPRDAGEWIEHGTLSLAGTPEPAPGDEASSPHGEAVLDLDADASHAASGISHDDPPRERTIDLPAPGREPARKRGRPVVERPGPKEMGDGLIIPPSPDPFAAPIPDLGEPIERRRNPRVAASFETRVAMLRLTGSRVSPIRGEMFDLSTSGLGVRFAKQALGASGRALADAVVAVELDVPGSDGPLRVAAQVRWLEVDDDGDEARIGIEFVLMTEPDRRRIAATLATVPQASADSTPETP